FAKSFQQDVVSNQMTLTRDAWNARMDFTLYTPRLTLRPLKREDAKAFAALTVPEVTRNLARVSTGMSVQDVIADLPRRRWRGYVGFTIGIEKQGELIGTIGFGGQPSIGYFIGPEHWGQGIMSEALSAFLPELFNRFPINRLHADHFEDNPASGTLLRKFGFKEVGRDIHTSKARLEPAPVITYALARESLRVPV
ncbi:MAG: GNAT family N-acetyltransferase, partial [Paracoccaceae bacterium]